MNALIHNTTWVPGHFHTTVGSASALTFMGACYVVVPQLLRRRLELTPLARVQPWLWFVGMLLFSIPTHLTGVMGMPRRVFDPSYGDHPTAVNWHWLTNLSAVGGIVLFASALFFVLVMLFTLFGPPVENGRLEFSEPLHDPGSTGAYLDRLGYLAVVAILLVAVAYGYPIWHHLQMPRFGSPGFAPF
jgi:cytochrome c oxidase subunit 1